MIRHSSRFCLTIAAAALLWCASDAVTLAAKTPVPIPNTTWLTAGKLKAKASRLGGFSSLGEAGISFSPADGIGFPATGTFNCVISDLDPDVEFVIIVTGTYSQDELGKILLTPEEAPIETQINDLIMGLLAEVPIVPDDLAVEMIKCSAKAKTGTSTKLGTYIKLKFQAKAAVIVTLGPDSVALKVNMSYNGTGSMPL